MVDPREKNVAILGGGPAGLSAGKVLADAGVRVIAFEKDDDVGGLSRTHEKDGFRFDLGGHRFFTKKNQLNQFLQPLIIQHLVFDLFHDCPLKLVFGQCLGSTGINALFEVTIEGVIVILMRLGTSPYHRVSA